MTRRHYIIRKTPLPRPTKPLPRSLKPIRKISKKKAKEQRAWTNDGGLGRCQIRIHKDCTVWATGRHHRKAQSQGGKDTPENKLAACGPCHRWCHLFPKRAAELGFSVSRKYDKVKPT